MVISVMDPGSNPTQGRQGNSTPGDLSDWTVVQNVCKLKIKSKTATMEGSNVF